MYVTTDQAMAGGRELLGFPKKLATIEIDALGTQFTGRLSRQGAHLASISFNQGKMLFSVPLPAQEQAVLPEPTGIFASRVPICQGYARSCSRTW